MGIGPTPRRILVAEDNVDTADSLSLLLRLYGHDVRVARTGPTALEMALASRPDVVLLDNMNMAELTEAVQLAKGRVVLEASGGVTLDSIAAIAATGVDYASCGALTHSAPNFDIALDIDV